MFRRRPEMIRQRMERFEGFDFGRGFGGREAAVVTAFQERQFTICHS